MEWTFEEIIECHTRHNRPIRYSLYTLAWRCDNWRIRNAAAHILAYDDPEEWSLERFCEENAEFAEWGRD